MSEELKQIEAVLDEKVRPSLRAHGGGLEIDHLEAGVLAEDRTGRRLSRRIPAARAAELGLVPGGFCRRSDLHI